MSSAPVAVQIRRLKICFISEPLHAGVGRYVVDAVSELARRGHEVHLLYSPIRVEPEFLSQLHHLPNVYCEPVLMPRAIGIGDISAFRAINGYVQTKGPFDIIHGCSSKGGGYARLLKLFGRGPVLYSPQAFITFSPVVRGAKRLFYRVLERVFARLTDKIVCASRAEVKHAEELGIAPGRLALIPNGTPVSHRPSREDIRAELGLPANSVVIGFVGRMADQKAPERLVAAAHRLLPQMPNLVLLMIGDGPKRRALEAGLANARLQDRALWLGAVDARRFLPAMDMFVLPSLYEGFAYVLIEALQAGLPIISTPVGGAHESISPGVNGIIVPHNSPLALSEAIKILAVDPRLRHSMGRASRLHADRFSAANMVDALEALYASLLLRSTETAEQAMPAATPLAGPAANY
jgi:glycosyltransferase involved in cell wall biosynthesis